MVMESLQRQVDCTRMTEMNELSQTGDGELRSPPDETGRADPETGQAKGDDAGKPTIRPQRAGRQLTELTGKTVGQVRCKDPFMIAEDVNVYYGDNHAIRDVTLEFGN